MHTISHDPYAPEELEYRFQELRAQRARARQLFYCYASDSEATEGEDERDIYYGYYAEDHGH